MRYLYSRYIEKMREKAYRTYISECCRIITENTAKAVQSGEYMKMSLNDIVKPKPKIDPEAQIEDIINRAGLVVK